MNEAGKAYDRLPLTCMAQEAIARHLQPGDCVIDATVGNGHDTLFLANCVGNTGHIYGFDIQQTALHAAQQRLQMADVSTRVDWLLAGHETMLDRLPVAVRGQVQAVMFNLGYLPGSDKRCVTRAEQTLQAVEQALLLLKPAGVLSVLAYTGHEHGQQEVDALRNWMRNLDENRWSTRWVYNEQSRGPSPQWVWVQGRRSRR